MKKPLRLLAVLAALLFALPLLSLPVLAGELPYWYPDDPDSWVEFHTDESTKRVVDLADVFTDEEETLLEERSRELRDELGVDVVIYTDMTDYSFDVSILAADFYDYCGYGCGDDFDGICLFLLMDPENRQGWACASGRLEYLYSEDAANDLDDRLYDYLGDGKFFEGVYDWMFNIGTLADKGIPFAPEWYPSQSEGFIRSHNASYPRVTDITGKLSDDEIRDLTERAKALSDKLGIDVAIHFTNTSCGMGRQDYSDAYFKYNGLGFGADYDGVLATIFTGSGTVVLTVSGSAAEKLTEKNIELIEEGVEDKAESDKFYGAGKRFVRYLGSTLSTGRVPRTPIVWGLRIAFAAVAALIVSSIVTAKAKANMKTVRTKYEADSYLDRDSLKIVNVKDEYTHTSQTRVYSPIDRGGSGGTRSGGSSGRSSYSGSYHGSSGRSHSGSGRKF